MTKRAKRLPFSPVTKEWNGPPPAPDPESFKRKKNQKKGSKYSVTMLTEFAEGLRQQASQLKLREPSIHVRIGRVVEQMEAEGSFGRGTVHGIEAVLKAWDPKQKGEVARAQMVSTPRPACAL